MLLCLFVFVLCSAYSFAKPKGFNAIKRKKEQQQQQQKMHAWWTEEIDMEITFMFVDSPKWNENMAKHMVSSMRMHGPINHIETAIKMPDERATVAKEKSEHRTLTGMGKTNYDNIKMLIHGLSWTKNSMPVSTPDLNPIRTNWIQEAKWSRSFWNWNSFCVRIGFTMIPMPGLALATVCV